MMGVWGKNREEVGGFSIIGGLLSVGAWAKKIGKMLGIYRERQEIRAFVFCLSDALNIWCVGR